jgi:hypothetical protein
MQKTLVIVLAEIRADKLTFNNFKKNVIDTLNADLCICIGKTPGKTPDEDNGFYKLAKYKFMYDEPSDYSDAFDYAYEKIIKQGNIEDPPIQWRKFLTIKKQFMGGIKHPYNEHPGSAGILIFFRWFLLKNLIENKLIEQYDRFVVTRSDYIYTLPHPKMELLDTVFIWIPNAEDYGGYTDRHVILSKSNIVQYLNILNNMITSNSYFDKMKSYMDWNLEKLIKFHLVQNNVNHLVKRTPYIMYTVREPNGTTRWSTGVFSNEHNYFIKYTSEYNISNHYKNLYNSMDSIDDFYKKILANI